MENTTKAILIGVGLFITIALISAVLVIMGVGNNLIRSSSDNLNGIASSLASSLTEKYDDKIVSGADVAACMKEYYNSNQLTICLNNIAAENNGAISAPAATAAKANLTAQVGYKAITASAPAADGKMQATDYPASPALKSAQKYQTAWLSDSGAGCYVKAQSTYKANLVYSNGELVAVAFTKLS